MTLYLRTRYKIPGMLTCINMCVLLLYVYTRYTATCYVCILISSLYNTLWWWWWCPNDSLRLYAWFRMTLYDYASFLSFFSFLPFFLSPFFHVFSLSFLFPFPLVWFHFLLGEVCMCTGVRIFIYTMCYVRTAVTINQVHRPSTYIREYCVVCILTVCCVMFFAEAFLFFHSRVFLSRSCDHGLLLPTYVERIPPRNGAPPAA